MLLAAIVCYARVLHGSWWAFAAFFLTPDLSLLGYAARRHGSRAAAVYNAVHAYALPVALAAWSWCESEPVGETAVAIWIAHIAMDRMLGFGLKYPEAFQPTHLQTVRSFQP